LLRYAGHWALAGYGYWIVEERESGRPVGEVGLADFRREISPPLAASLRWGGSSPVLLRVRGTQRRRGGPCWRGATRRYRARDSRDHRAMRTCFDQGRAEARFRETGVAVYRGEPYSCCARLTLGAPSAAERGRSRGRPGRPRLEHDRGFESAASGRRRGADVRLPTPLARMDARAETDAGPRALAMRGLLSCSAGSCHSRRRSLGPTSRRPTVNSISSRT